MGRDLSCRPGMMPSWGTFAVRMPRTLTASLCWPLSAACLEALHMLSLNGMKMHRKQLTTCMKLSLTGT